jgi:hypothetical protein
MRPWYQYPRQRDAEPQAVGVLVAGWVFIRWYLLERWHKKLMIL